MIALEKYADLCALMAETAGDEAKENAIAEAHGVSPADWKASKTGYTAKMSDPNDMGKTAMAFMPLYQAAQARARGGAEPCTLEVYTRVHAEMAFRKDAAGQKMNFHLILAEHKIPYTLWLECEGYWTPRVASDKEAKFNPEQAMTFRALMQKESDQIAGIKR